MLERPMSKKLTILRAATHLFARKGYRDTSMAKLSQITGVAGGTIFYHFKSKEALFLEILVEVKEEILSDIKQFFSKSKYANGLEMIGGAISHYLQLVVKMEDQFFLLHRYDPYNLALVNPVCRNHLEDIYDCLVNLFEKAILDGHKDGSIGKYHARKTALIIFSMVDGIARLNTFKLYDAGALYQELQASCRRMLRPQ